MAQLPAEENVNTITHFVAAFHVNSLILFPSVFVQTNVVGTLNFLEAFH